MKANRKSTVLFQFGSNEKNLAPGLYSIHDGREIKYVGSFMVRPDQTVEFYGLNLVIVREEVSATTKKGVSNER